MRFFTVSLRAAFAAPEAIAAEYVTAVGFGGDDDSIRIDFATAATGGLVDETGLAALSFTLLDGSRTIYTDTAIARGDVQRLAGVDRGISFMFDLDAHAADPAEGLLGFDNDLFMDQEGAATGLSYNLVGPGLGGALTTADRFFDGVFTGGVVGQTVSIATTRLDAAQAMPRPALWRRPPSPTAEPAGLRRLQQA